MNKKWKIKEPVSQKLTEQFPEINSVALQLLVNRELSTQQDIDDFLNPNFDDHILDPFLFNNMTKAVERIFQAVNKHEKVMIYGDYDADGVCSTAILYKTFKALGLNVDVRIPFRETEGYGLNKTSVQEIIDQGFTLVVTVDCGVSNVKEVELFNQNNVEVIITDHHQEPPELPLAYAIINPSVKSCGYPFNKLCGAGVAFKLVQAIVKLQKDYNTPVKLPDGFEKWLLDLVAVATIGDMMPLIKENRSFVKYGLIVLEKTKNIGLKKMIDLVSRGNKVDSQMIGWRVVPRLNAAGRINDASIGFNLLTTQSQPEADRLLQLLENNNLQRQKITDDLLKQAEDQVAPQLEADKKIFWVIGENWPEGVLGLVAGRITDKYHRPTLVISKKSEGEDFKFTGSGRSIIEFDITAGLNQCKDYLAKYGGHPQACGFTALGEENFKKLRKILSELVESGLKPEDLVPILVVDAKVELKDLTWEILDLLEQFEPFGEANYRPLFAAYSLKVEQIYPVGADAKHLKLLVSQKDHPEIHKLIGFFFGQWLEKLNINDTIDIVFEFGINEWNGNRELQLKIVDIREAKN